MAITKTHPIKSTLKKAIDYICNPEKTDGKLLVFAEPMKTGFADAWKIINESVRNFEWPEKCHSCDINSRCNFCPVKHSKVIHLHQCDENACNYVRNKINRNAKG